MKTHLNLPGTWYYTAKFRCVFIFVLYDIDILKTFILPQLVKKAIYIILFVGRLSNVVNKHIKKQELKIILYIFLSKKCIDVIIK